MRWMSRAVLCAAWIGAGGCADLVEGQAAGGDATGQASSGTSGGGLLTSSAVTTITGGTGSTGESGTGVSEPSGDATAGSEASNTLPITTAPSTGPESTTSGPNTGDEESGPTSSSSSSSSSSGQAGCVNEDQEPDDPMAEPLANQTCNGADAVAFDGVLDADDGTDWYAFDVAWTENGCGEANPRVFLEATGTRVCYYADCDAGTPDLLCTDASPYYAGQGYVGCCRQDNLAVTVNCNILGGDESHRAAVLIANDGLDACFDYAGTVDIF